MLKRLFLLLFFSVICITTHSQTLQLKEFVQRDFDLSARRYMRTDINGDTCALLKVQLALPEAEFEGQINGVPELKSSIYWVYMQPGAKKVKVSLSGFLPLEIVFADYGIRSLQSQTTYVATIEVPTELLQMANDVGGKVVFFKRNSLYVGGGYSPLALSGATFLAGCTIYNVDIEVSYSLGIGNSRKVGWFANGSDVLNEVDTYTIDCFSAKLGYQLPLAGRLGVLPQIGYKAQMLKSSGEHGDGAICGNATVSAKLMLAIIKNLRFFVEPEYALAVQKSDTYANIAKIAKFEEGGLCLTCGLMFNF